VLNRVSVKVDIDAIAILVSHLARESFKFIDID